MHSSGFYRGISNTKIWRPPIKKGPRTSATIIVLLFLLVAVWISSSWIDSVSSNLIQTNKLYILTNMPYAIIYILVMLFPYLFFFFWVLQTSLAVINERKEKMVVSKPQRKAPKKKIEVPLNCSIGNATQTCSSNYPTTLDFTETDDSLLNVTCPNYFRWIHEDLKPFKATGITREMVERANNTAHFRLVIVKGKVYVEKYKKSIQTRDVFTLWGILQLLRRYPGRLPDLELMFDCDDRPVIQSRSYRGPNAKAPPPLFRYCGDPWTLDIVFPDWSFWGW